MTVAEGRVPEGPSENDVLRIDLGCGSAKRAGYVGLDNFALPGVDHVLDLTADPLPFADDSVDFVFSSHFLEHIGPPNHVLGEIGRVCRDGAQIEIWTPYAFTDEAFLYGHTTHFTETTWWHFCVLHRDVYFPMLGGRWNLDSITYVVLPEVRSDLEVQGVPLDFAVKYLKGVVNEFGVHITYRSDFDAPLVAPARLWAPNRSEPGVPLVPQPGTASPAPPPPSLRAAVGQYVPVPIKVKIRGLKRRLTSSGRAAGG